MPSNQRVRWKLALLILGTATTVIIALAAIWDWTFQERLSTLLAFFLLVLIPLSAVYLVPLWLRHMGLIRGIALPVCAIAFIASAYLWLIHPPGGRLRMLNPGNRFELLLGIEGRICAGHFHLVRSRCGVCRTVGTHRGGCLAYGISIFDVEQEPVTGRLFQFYKPRISWAVFDAQAVRIPFWAATFATGLYPACSIFVFFLRPHWRRRRNRCLHCAYDLTGNESGVCPECGMAIFANDGPA